LVFSSPGFLFLFLPGVLLAYAVTPRPLRNVVLLLASLVFYVWGEAEHLWLLILLIVINWLAGLAIGRAPTAVRVAVLTAAVAADLAALIFFKYAHFLAGNLVLVGMQWSWVGALATAPLVLPLGISFYVFHTISYVVDVARRTAPTQCNPLNFGLYIAFFPQLIAGPIVRYHDIAAMLTQRRPSLPSFASGTERFLAGLAKKMLLANPAGLVADQVFAVPPHALTTGAAWVGVVFYTLQIYFDFSGYSDMAIGLARMFGFNFLENFNYPYISRSMQEFWRRWHISLSNWFREYVYIPLGGNRAGALRTCLNLSLVFLLCGFWHGASWNFVVWGLVHGAFLSAERLGLGRALARMPRAVGHGYTLLVVMAAWVLFRSETLGNAITYYYAMLGLQPGQAAALPIDALLDRQTLLVLVLGIVGSTPVLSWLTRDWRHRAIQRHGELDVLSHKTDDSTGLRLVRLLLLVGLTGLSFLQVASSAYNPFIYYRF
jgi:alginate O-acetyltransferase complex protein AlgI